MWLIATLTSTLAGALPTPPTVELSVERVRRSTAGPNFLCYNLDASANRGFFWRNISLHNGLGQRIARQAAALALGQEAEYSLLRFGGEGNDFLTYAFGGDSCPQPATPTHQCMNESTWRAVLDLSAASNARLIVGLSMNTGVDLGRRRPGDDPFPYPWDPSNARKLLQWTIDAKLDHLIYGLELGNEQNAKYSATQIAHNFAILAQLTKELWPAHTHASGSSGHVPPKIFGPDPHGLHTPTRARESPRLLGPDPHSFRGGLPGTNATLEWIREWLTASRAAGVPVHAVTHHEYIEVEPNASGFTDPTRLDMSGEIAHKVNATVRSVDANVAIIAGEIGPHNGGNPPCNHSSMRWAVFGDSLWYADALAAKAFHGYEAFCRQDLIGGDYGLLDCRDGTALPDYFVALLWTRTMGRVVLSTRARAEDEGEGAGALHWSLGGAATAFAHAGQHEHEHEPSAGGAAALLRLYAQCSAPSGGFAAGSVTVLAINLDQRARGLTFEGLGKDALAYALEANGDPNASLTGKGGLLGTGVLLNRRPVSVGVDGTVPPLPAEAVGKATVVVPPVSVAFYVLPHAAHPECSGSEKA